MLPPADPPALITVLAGVNGAGKSSILGARVRELGGDYINLDEFTRELLAANPGLSGREANQIAWESGREALAGAIAERRDLALETTLGGRTITGLLQGALEQGLRVNMAYVGLDGPELHIARVTARVALGGHDIESGRIRLRYTKSRQNLVRLIPRLSHLRVYDNSAEADLGGGQAPEPLLVLETREGRIIRSCAIEVVPDWAKPVVEAALRLEPGGEGAGRPASAQAALRRP